MNKQYDLAVVIGRFQPFHKGHQHCIETAFKHSKNVLVLVGSSNVSISPKNPFPFELRQKMIRISCDNKTRLQVQPINDYVYNEQRWIQEIQDIIATQKLVYGYKNIVLVGHAKDESSYYLNIFPQWHFIDSGFYPFEFDTTIDGTKIRELLFEGQKPYIAGVLAPTVLSIINEYEKTEEYKQTLREYHDIKQQKQLWAASPYPPVFVTTDAVVLQSGHILLIRRKDNPGKGLWALPGGFIDVKQQLFESCVRELREETGLKVPEVILKKSLTASHVFDNPSRSLRGRTITHAYLFYLDDTKDLPRIKGGDDAEKAQWVPLSEVEHMATQLFEDHWHIINYFLNQANKS
jgi:bifunctional NMN adenylyltransferase/nudix hydrolase